MSLQSAAEVLGCDTLAKFVSAREAKVDRPLSFLIPPDSGRKTVLARHFAHLLEGEIFIWIDEWGIWASCEHFELFDSYRRAHGERRSLDEAPVHQFAAGEHDSRTSVLSLVLYFVWGAWVFDRQARYLLRISHDEWFDMSGSEENLRNEFREIAARLELEPTTSKPQA